MISVVIPLYNKEKSIANTLRTVLQQTYQNFEIVVVNDGSTDNSLAEAESVNDSRIRIVSQPNSGVSAARNKGIEEAKFDLIAFLDADDEWKPEYLETQYNLYKKYPECSVFACNYEFRDHTGKVTPTIIRKLPFDGQDGILTNYFEVASCSHPPLWTSAIVVSKEAIKAVGGFPIGIKSGEDLLTWARLATICRLVYCKITLAVFVNDSQIFNEDQKWREPEVKDYVANELKQLLQKHHDIQGLKKYIALWHKMRAKIYLDKDKKKAALQECIKSMYFHINLKILVFFILCFCPTSITKYILTKNEGNNNSY